MAGRIRTIKPEILDDEHAAALSDGAWRLWVSSWVLADDQGRFRAGIRYLAANVWQNTERIDHANAALQELARAGFLRRYTNGGEVYAEIKPSGWTRHQRIDRPSAPRMPVPAEGDYIDHQTARVPMLTHDFSRALGASREEFPSRARAGSPISDLRPRSPISDPEGEHEGKGLASGSSPPAGERAKKGSRIAPDWSPSEELISWAATAEAVKMERGDVLRIAEAFRDYWMAKPGKEAVKLDWPATFRGWLRRERERHPELPVASGARGKPPAPPPNKFGAELAKNLASTADRTPDPQGNLPRIGGDFG